MTGRLQFRATGDPAERAAGKLTLTVIRDELARIVAQRAADDPHLHYLDGRELYGEADFAELPLPDQLHPDAADPPPHRRALRRAGLRRRRPVHRPGYAGGVVTVAVAAGPVPMAVTAATEKVYAVAGRRPPTTRHHALGGRSGRPGRPGRSRRSVRPSETVIR